MSISYDLYEEFLGDGPDDGVKEQNGFTAPAAAEVLDGGNVGGRQVGTDDDDRLIGTGKRDVLIGKKGDDFIDGKAGRDLVNAGPGNDRINDSGGNADTLFGAGGNDLIRAGRGDDYVDGGDGDDRLFGQTGDDLIAGGKGDDVLRGGLGDDALFGGAGSDTFSFKIGRDVSSEFSTDTVIDFTDEDVLDLSAPERFTFDGEQNGHDFVVTVVGGGNNARAEIVFRDYDGAAGFEDVTAAQVEAFFNGPSDDLMH